MPWMALYIWQSQIENKSKKLLKGRVQPKQARLSFNPSHLSFQYNRKAQLILAGVQPKGLLCQRAL